MVRRHLFHATLAFGIGLGVIVTAVAGAPRTYQVTGPLVELSTEKLVVAVREERMEFARDATAQITGDLVLGATVTVTFRMTATAVTVKTEPQAVPAPSPATSAPEPGSTR